MPQEKVALQSPNKLQSNRKTLGLVVMLTIVISIAAIGAITKGGKKRVEPVTWKPGGTVDTSELELTNLRSEMKGLEDKIKKMDKDYQDKIKQVESQLEDKYSEKLKKIEENASKSNSEDKKESTNILGSGIPDDAEFDTYVLPSLDGKETTVLPIPESTVPVPPKIQRISAAEYNKSKSSNTNPSSSYQESDTFDSFSVIDPENDFTDGENVFTNKDIITVKKTYEKNPMAGFIPATSSAPIVIFTGLDAIASGAAQGNPEPVLFRVQDHAFLAGDARYRMSNCNGTAVGYGDLSTTRVKLQATRLVCVDLIENRLLESEINAFITDSDGTLGMRGEVQNREGQIAGKALAASFAEGAAGILTAAGTTVSNANGITQTTSVLDGFNNGFASGTSNAASMLAERYIEQMEAISPSITVEKGRRGVIHFLAGTKLEWKEYQGAYVEKITPELGN